jgi:hypothetical protein
MFHTVYDSFEHKPHGRDYIGKHSTDNPYDDYKGSFKDQEFDPEDKIVFAYAKTAEGAVWLEIMFQKVFDVVRDPQYANRAYQTSTGFSQAGVTPSLETRQKLRKAFSVENNPMYGKNGEDHPKYGVKESLETRQKKSKAMSGSNNPMFGKTGENNPNFGSTRSEESRQRMKERNRGENNPMYGRTAENNPNYSKKWWVNFSGETLLQAESPGLGWQLGRKWKG